MPDLMYWTYSEPRDKSHNSSPVPTNPVMKLFASPVVWLERQRTSYLLRSKRNQILRFPHKRSC